MLSTIAVIYNLVAHAGFGYETFGHNKYDQKSFYFNRRMNYERLLSIAQRTDFG